MHFKDLNHFLSEGKSALASGPIALILLEDTVEIDSSIRHHIEAGFISVVTFGAFEIDCFDNFATNVHHVHFDATAQGAQVTVVNAVIEKALSQWIYYCYNAEYIFFPFCEHRTIGEMLNFHAEERRNAVLTYVVDLYAGDLIQNPTAVSLDDAYIDKSGYYALPRTNTKKEFAERQLDFFGGLRWRFEEYVPTTSRRIDRISIFRAKAGLRLKADHTFNDSEYNTYACPWHHSITAAIVSFRTAKALKRNPMSAAQISTFRWHNSTRFEWHSQQLLNLGLMEPGQWF